MPWRRWRTRGRNSCCHESAAREAFKEPAKICARRGGLCSVCVLRMSCDEVIRLCSWHSLRPVRRFEPNATEHLSQRMDAFRLGTYVNMPWPWHTALYLRCTTYSLSPPISSYRSPDWLCGSSQRNLPCSRACRVHASRCCGGGFRDQVLLISRTAWCVTKRVQG